MKNNKKKTWSEILSYLVLSSKHAKKDCFDYIDATYKTLCDIGICLPNMDDYTPDVKNIKYKEYNLWLKIKNATR